MASNQNLNFRGGATQSMPLKPDIDQKIENTPATGITVSIRVRRFGKMVNIYGTAVNSSSETFSDTAAGGIDSTCLLSEDFMFYAKDVDGYYPYSAHCLINTNGSIAIYALRAGRTAYINETYFMD